MNAPPLSPAAPWLHSAFYRFVELADPLDVARQVREAAAECRLGGTVIVAHEGINGAIAGTPADVAAFERRMTSADRLGGALHGLAFKHSDGHTRPFARMKVRVKSEIVALAFPGEATLPRPDEHDGSHVPPEAWRQLIARDDVVVLDNRNHFEFRLGHFVNAIDPQVDNFRDFVAYVEAHAPQWREQGREVAMYCTGGIRCDKTAPWMSSLGLKVWQLDGGILNYCEQLPDAHLDWLGECFVFDNRVALDTRLNESDTRADEVFDPTLPDEAWRLERARRLAQADP